MSSTSQVFQDAADKIRNGWMQGDFTDEMGNVCLVESLRDPETGEIDVEDLEILSRRLLWFPDYFFIRLEKGADTPEILIEGIAKWNDLRWRDRATVIGVLVSIARKLAKRETAKATLRLAA